MHEKYLLLKSDRDFPELLKSLEVYLAYRLEGVERNT